MTHYEVLNEGKTPIKSWTRGVAFAQEAKQQLLNLSTLAFIHQWIAVMPDVHLGKGATIGSVVPTIGAVIPAAVGVDIGCGMMAVKTSIKACQLPDNLFSIRCKMEEAIPHGRSVKQGRASKDKGAWDEIPKEVALAWAPLHKQFKLLKEKHPVLEKTNNINHLGTLGTGNHFIELCIDEYQDVWLMLHSGSRGVGNRIGTHFIEQAKKDMQRWKIHLPDKDLAYLPEGTEHFNDYIEAVAWAQRFARINRELMMSQLLLTLRDALDFPFDANLKAINCHHNYVSREHHYNQEVLVTRKGALRARKGEMGIIPGSMGARSYIVRGLGNKESFSSCSHGAGRIMSRTQAKKQVSLEAHLKSMAGVECRSDAGVIDETPAAYKDIEAVMQAQKDLVEIVHTLKQIVCIKG